MPSPAGARIYRVNLQQPSYGADTTGDVRTAVWFTIGTLWVNIESLADNITAKTAAEIINSGQIVALNSFRVTLPYRQGLTNTMRFQWGERYLYIFGLSGLLGDHGEMQVLCKEQV